MGELLSAPGYLLELNIPFMNLFDPVFRRHYRERYVKNSVVEGHNAEACLIARPE